MIEGDDSWRRGSDHAKVRSSPPFSDLEGATRWISEHDVLVTKLIEQFPLESGDRCLLGAFFCRGSGAAICAFARCDQLVPELFRRAVIELPYLRGSRSGHAEQQQNDH